MSQKGLLTRERIIDRAFRLASRDGLEGLSIGGLATELGLSKSGLFAHFGSKEDLQIEVLKAAAANFEEGVMRPSFREARGLPRIRELFENWLRWITDPAMAGGCLFIAAAAELDDQKGKTRDLLVGLQRQLLEAIAKSARLAIETGHFRGDLDCGQFAFEFYGIVLSFNHSKRLLRDPDAEQRAHGAFDRLILFASKK